MTSSATTDLKDPKDCTSHELMLVLVPDIEERITAMKEAHPEHFEELWNRVAFREGGFQPFAHWNEPL